MNVSLVSLVSGLSSSPSQPITRAAAKTPEERIAVALDPAGCVVVPGP